jgi:hypothetical protein
VERLNANREYKDGLFRTLFNTPEKALQLYCDITGKTCGRDTIIEMNSLDTVFMSKLRNDLAFLIDDVLIVIMEHQPTPNKNMPLRSLQYVLLFYEIYCELGDALYREKLIKLPKPEFYVLYNGQSPYPLRGIMRLSEAFLGLEANEQPNLELIVNVLNINYGDNVDVLERNEDLKGYSLFVSKIRGRQKEGKSLPEAIRITVNECLSEGILNEFLSQFGNEVEAMFSLVYDEEKAIRYAREEGRVEGREEGREEGLEIIRALKEKVPVDKIAAQYNISIEEVEQYRSVLTL